MITFSYRGTLVIVPFSKAKSSVSSRKMWLIGCYVTGGRTSVWLSWDRETATLRDRHFPHCREGRSFYGIRNQSGTEARKRKKTWLGRQSAGSVLTVGSIAPRPLPRSTRERLLDARTLLCICKRSLG